MTPEESLVCVAVVGSCEPKVRVEPVAGVLHASIAPSPAFPCRIPRTAKGFLAPLSVSRSLYSQRGCQGQDQQIPERKAIAMTGVMETGFDEVMRDFAAAKISTEEPGFYEDGAFIRREAKTPHYLFNYARFVDHQPYHPGYLDRAEPIIHVVSEELQLALKEDGSQEAHAEAPLVMSRILEREGVWNYVVSGALSITFPSDSGFEPFSFYSLEVRQERAVDCSYHWVVAPPFQIIDIAIQACKYPNPCNHLLPKIVWENNAEPTVAELGDIFNPKGVKQITDAGMSMDEALDRYLPYYRGAFADSFPPRLVNRMGTQLKYVPTDILVAEQSLEQFKCFKSRGLNAAQIYAEKIQPRLS
jgi:hypothetical protein